MADRQRSPNKSFRLPGRLRSAAPQLVKAWETESTRQATSHLHKTGPRARGSTGSRAHAYVSEIAWLSIVSGRSRGHLNHLHQWPRRRPLNRTGSAGPLVRRTPRISCEAVRPSVLAAGEQGGTSACSTGAALGFVSCIRLLGDAEHLTP
jgi:hypothetical protein